MLYDFVSHVIESWASLIRIKNVKCTSLRGVPAEEWPKTELEIVYHGAHRRSHSIILSLF